MAAAISGSAWSREAVKNESSAEAVLAEVILRISPPPQPFGGLRSVLCGGRKQAAIYHIAPARPSICGSVLIFMQDMVGIVPFCSPAKLRTAPPHPAARCVPERRPLAVPDFTGGLSRLSSQTGITR